MLKELYTLIKLIFQKDKIGEVVTMKHFPFKGYSCMSWFGKIIVRGERKLPDVVLSHEHIHTLQYYYNNLFYLKYLWYWIIRNPLIKPYKGAYYTIPFEIEAYANQDNNDYVVSKDSYKKYIVKRKLYKEHLKDWKQFIKTL